MLCVLVVQCKKMFSPRVEAVTVLFVLTCVCLCLCVLTGFFETLLHWLSPSLITSLVIGSVALAVTVGSGATAIGLMLLTLALRQ